MARRTAFACFVSLLIILPILGRSIHQGNIKDYGRVVEHNIEQTLPVGMTMDMYRDSVLSYWTPERMASAKPMGLLMINDSSSFITANHSPQPIDDGRTLIPAAVPGVRPKSPNAYESVVGKVYMRFGSSNYVCSGSVIRGENRDTLLTAGHCVWNTDTQEWVSQLIFVPEYNRGSEPYGAWAARTVVALAGWTQYGDFNYDVAIVLVSASISGEHVQDLTGALGMTKNWARQAYTDAYGYPMNLHQGEQLSTCSGQCAPAKVSQYNGMELDCNMEGGSSGGPWTQEGNFQTSVNSFGITTRPNVMFGPSFGDEIYNAWEEYQTK